MPKLERYSLAWSPLHQAYELYERQRNEALDIVPTSLVRLVWAGQVSSFAFHGQNGSCTACKERRPHGEEAYWFAYARVGRKVTKRYSGRSTHCLRPNSTFRVPIWCIVLACSKDCRRAGSGH